MKTFLVIVGKTNEKWLKAGIDDYLSRICKYIPFSVILIDDIKNRSNMPEIVIKNKEGELILNKIAPNDVLILLDEKGKTLSSRDFADFIQKQMNLGLRNVYFIIGGAYGFSQAVYDRCNHKISLSPMTFSHQLARLIFTEQFYRALTIINNEPYHHGN